MKIVRIILLLAIIQPVFSQNNWPAAAWNSATNLTPIMSSSGIDEASGLYWNKATNRLYLVQNSGRVRVLQFNSGTNSFSQIGNKSISGGPEGITMANNSENAFYVIDENNYEIRKYTHTSDFGTVTQAKSWDLLQSPSTMTDTGNTGPEGICFIADTFLTQANFISQTTGLPYVSQKGMGGLLFIAHQNGGYIWVFDVNPNVTDDFAFVGKYKTNRSESCDLSFDGSTGLLYILHNTDGNILETVTLASSIISSERKLNMTNEYFLPMPSGNTNIEGFAITEKCPSGNTVSAWVCRDTSSSESSSILTDALRWFSPYTDNFDCSSLSTAQNQYEQTISVYPNPVGDILEIQAVDFRATKLEIYNVLGEKIMTQSNSATAIDVSNLKQGFYFLFISNDNETAKITFIKK